MSIDIDKERKAYCAWAETITDRQFQTMTLEEVWLAAKRHAAEVGEPINRTSAKFARVAPAAPSGASVEGWISVDERLPPVSELVVVFTPWCENDWPGSVNIGLDCIDPNDDEHASWEGHNNHYEHYCCVAKGEDCTGPSEKAPYTHWHALAPIPVDAAMSPNKEGL